VHRLSYCALAILTASIAVACDPGFGVWFRNDSNAPVIVQFIHQGEAADLERASQ